MSDKIRLLDEIEHDIINYQMKYEVSAKAKADNTDTWFANS